MALPLGLLAAIAAGLCLLTLAALALSSFVAVVATLRAQRADRRRDDELDAFLAEVLARPAPTGSMLRR